MQPQRPEKNTFYPDHSADPRERRSRSGQRKMRFTQITAQTPAKDAAAAAGQENRREEEWNAAGS
jgi:hypothetical protein